MKKGILVFFITCSLTAFAYVNWERPVQPENVITCRSAIPVQPYKHLGCKPPAINLFYKVGSRFNATISKEDLRKATTVADIVPDRAEWSKIAFRTMKVAVMQDGGEDVEALGDDGTLTAEQLKLLQTADYSTNFNLHGKGTNKTNSLAVSQGAIWEESPYAYYLTVVPEQEATFIAGYDALIAYLKESSKEQTSFITEKGLLPCRIDFTVTKAGTIEHISIDASSGFPKVDQTLVQLVRDMTGMWTPARNASGEPVDQQLVFFFGKEGC